MKKLIIFTFFLSVLFIACQDFSKNNKAELAAPNLPEITYDYLDVESSNPVTSAENLVSRMKSSNIDNDIATLGRVLFYDKKLSITNRISCGSCHKQHLGFSDGKKFSEGFRNELTTRNSMSISNGMMTSKFFWDTRTSDLSKLVLEPIQNHIEMGLEDLEYLNEKLKDVEYYPELFSAAYGSENITTERISTALVQFLNAMVSFNSDFDKREVSTLAEVGFELFEANCASCHNEPRVSSNWGSHTRRANIGLDFEYEDAGLGAWSASDHFDGVFKVPSLRNIALSSPYMHDGRFATLDEVIDHYSEGIQNHPNLSWSLQEYDSNGDLVPKNLNFDKDQKLALKALLESFTDEKFLTDERYSDPFQ